MYELQYMEISINDKEKKRNVKEKLLIYIIKRQVTCMKIQKYKFEKNEMLQIYIKKSEQEDLKIIQEINELKKHYSNITMFISGENKTIKTIKEMMNYEKSKNKR